MGCRLHCTNILKPTAFDALQYAATGYLEYFLIFLWNPWLMRILNEKNIHLKTKRHGNP